MNPYYERNGIKIYHGDCREMLPGVSADAVVSDPPYGMKWNTDSTRFSGGKSNRRRGAGRSDWGAISGDADQFDPSPWLAFKSCILWGANHYASRLPVGTTLVWLKKADHLFGRFLSDCEIGWMKGGHGVYAFRKNFPPPSRMAEGGGVCLHPTQKPVALMRWCIEKTSGTVLDPFMGSGTTLRAAKELGRNAIGIEVEERYCEIAAKRLEQEVLPLEVPA